MLWGPVALKPLCKRVCSALPCPLSPNSDLCSSCCKTLPQSVCQLMLRSRVPSPLLDGIHRPVCIICIPLLCVLTFLSSIQQSSILHIIRKYKVSPFGRLKHALYSALVGSSELSRRIANLCPGTVFVPHEVAWWFVCLAPQSGLPFG